MKLQKELIGHWELESTDAKDRSPYSNDGAVNGDPQVVNGQIGNALAFDGSGDYIKITEQLFDSNTSNKTISFWIYPTNLSSGSNQYALSLRNQTTIIVETGNQNNNGLSVYDGSLFRSAGDLTENEWTHVAITDDGSNFTVYNDGSLAYSDNNTTVPADGSSSAIGADRDGDTFYEGRIDDVRLYSRVLSQSEVRQLGQIRSKQAVTNDLYKGLVGHWEFESVEVKDSSPYGNDGSVNGDPQSVTGKIGNALDFDGDGDYIEIPNFPQADGQDITITMWVKPQGYDSNDNDDATMIIKDNSSFGKRVYRIFWNGTNMVYAVGNGAGTYSTQIFGDTTINQGTWYHVAFKMTSSEVKAFLNGSQDGNSASGDQPVETDTTILIGSAHASSFDFNGVIDDVRIYNRGLTETEVQRLANQEAKQVRQL